jgi:hypothetical protein
MGAQITAEMPLQKGRQKPKSDGQKPYGNHQQQGRQKKQRDQPATVRTSGTEGTLATSRNVSNSRVTSESIVTPVIVPAKAEIVDYFSENHEKLWK